MAASELTFDQIYKFFKDSGGKVTNRDVVRYFKHYLTDPRTKDDARVKFKEYVNTLCHTRLEGGEKFLYLKSKYANPAEHSPAYPAIPPISPQYDPRNSVGIPLSPSTRSPRQPPPYRPPPPVSSPTNSLDNISLGSINSLVEAPQAPPRRRSTDKLKVSEEDTRKNVLEEQAGVSVKERTQKFNRMASVDDELSGSSPRTPKSSKLKGGADEDDGAFDKPLEPKKCVEWYVTASKGDLQELLKLAKSEPRLVNKKDPFTTVLHWGAKYGNAEIIKVFAGKYKVDVNGKTGYTPLHICAQFGHKDLYRLLIDVYKADANLRDYSGKTAEHYLTLLLEKKYGSVPLRKLKGRKKQSEKDLGFLRIGSLNVRVKKTTEAFSNFLGVGSSVNPMETMVEKVHKGWGSADNVNKDEIMQPPKNYAPKKKSKRPYESGQNSTPTTPKTPTKLIGVRNVNDSDSDSAAGFDSNWKN